MKHLLRLVALAGRIVEERARAVELMAAPAREVTVPARAPVVEPAPSAVETPVYPPQGELLSGREVDWDSVSGATEVRKFG